MSFWEGIGDLALAVGYELVAPGPGLDPIALTATATCELASALIDGAELALQGASGEGYERAAKKYQALVDEKVREGCKREQQAFVEGAQWYKESHR